VRRDYLPDPLGNTIALLDTDHAVTDTWSYWPYGEVQAHSGPSTTALTFLGTLGYCVDFLNQLYVRARHLRADLARWLELDRYWPGQPAFQYACANPVNYSDPSGLLCLYGR
jgi:RHS repeat-associated protein